MEAYKKVIWGSSFLVILIVAAAIYFFFFYKDSKPEAQLPQTVEENMTIPEKDYKIIKKPVETPEDPVITFKLNESDDKIKELLKSCSTHPQFAKFLIEADFIRKFVAIVDNISNGKSPVKHLPFLLPVKKFLVIRKGDNILLDPVSYKRYDLLTDLFISIKTRESIQVYQRIDSLIDEAYKELGYPQKNFTKTLFQAIVILLKTPVVKGEIELEESLKSFKFKDSRLEKLNPAQKHLIRTGPQNTENIHSKLKEIALELGIPEEKLPFTQIRN